MAMNKNDIKLALLVIICISANTLGSELASWLNLPIWFDSFGTAFSAYLCGPVIGAIVGASTNILLGVVKGTPLAFAIINVFIGIVIGIGSKKGMLETLYGTLTLSIFVTIGSLMFAVPINFLAFGGATNNVWGNGVIGFLAERGVAKWLGAIIGQFYIEFLDKIITLLIVFFIVHIRRKLSKKAAKDVAVMIAFAILIGNLSPFTVNASAGDTYIYTVYRSDNGIPCGEANDVVETPDGVLWVGTYAGLYRYNGSEFRLMSDFDSVRNVNCLYVDVDGRLWIGTNDNGLSLCINDNVSSTIDMEDGLSSNSVRTIIRGGDGYYYVGTSDSLDIVSLESGLHFVKSIPEIKYAYSSSVNEDGTIAVLDTNGTVFLLKNGAIDSSFELNNQDEIITSVSFTKDGRLYAGTSENRVIVYGMTGGRASKVKEYDCKHLKNINQVYQTDDGKLYILSDTGIGYINDEDRFVPVNTNEFNNSIDRMIKDYQDNLWFASSRLGLLKMSESSFMDIYRTAGGKSVVVNSTMEWNGLLYSGTDNGLDAVSADRREMVENSLTEKLKGKRIRCLEVDDDNNLWICVFGEGVYIVDKDMKITVYDNSNPLMGDWARIAKRLKDGTMVTGSEAGLTFFENGKPSYVSTIDGTLKETMILSIDELDDGKIVLGTDGRGIYVLNSKGDLQTTINKQSGLSSDVVLRTVKDEGSNNGMFVVASNGLSYIDGDYNINALNNFPYYNNYDIKTISENEICVLSSSGVFVVDKKKLINGEKQEEILLDVKKGLNGPIVANSWNYMDRKGRLYLSCEDGIYMLDTTSFDTVRKSYRMHLSTVVMDNETYNIGRGEDIIIDKDVNKVTLYPEIINFTLEDPYVSYYLEGVDKEPVVCRLTELSNVSYTDIPAGSHRFFVSILEGDTGKVIESNSYKVIMEDHIYDHGYFMFYMLFVAALVLIWITWFVARVRMQRTLAIQNLHIEMAEKQLQMGNQTILAIARAVDAKDENTSQHSKRVSEYAVMIAKRMGLPDEECANLKKSALLHDIGKIGIPDSILNKPGRLTDEEYAIMKSHTVRGANILKEFTLIDHIVEGAQFHHEKYDGTGYPEGLKGKDIPLYGRIIGVADAFDAMTANRVYRKKLDFDYVINELKRCRGTQFDPEILDVFLELIDDGTVDVEELYHRSISGDINVEHKDEFATPLSEANQGEE